jgi:hypothetical protein
MVLRKGIGLEKRLQKASIGYFAPENGTAFHKGVKSAPDRTGIFCHARVKQYPGLTPAENRRVFYKTRQAGRDQAAPSIFAGSNEIGNKLALQEQIVNFTLPWRISWTPHPALVWVWH